MSTVTFDKRAYVESLKASGIDENQARAQASALDVALSEAVATKADIQDVKSDIQDVKLLIAETHSGILKWMCGLLLGQAALIAALVKLL